MDQGLSENAWTGDITSLLLGCGTDRCRTFDHDVNHSDGKSEVPDRKKHEALPFSVTNAAV